MSLKRAATTSLSHDLEETEVDTEPVKEPPGNTVGISTTETRKKIVPKRRLKASEERTEGRSNTFGVFKNLNFSIPEPPLKIAPPQKVEVQKNNEVCLTNTVMLSQLKELNEAFVGDVCSHVKQDVTCDLTPMFEDYTRHYEAICRPYIRDNSSNGFVAAIHSVPTSKVELETQSTEKMTTVTSAGLLATQSDTTTTSKASHLTAVVGDNAPSCSKVADISFGKNSSEPTIATTDTATSNGISKMNSQPSNPLQDNFSSTVSSNKPLFKFGNSGDSAGGFKFGISTSDTLPLTTSSSPFILGASFNRPPLAPDKTLTTVNNSTTSVSESLFKFGKQDTNPIISTTSSCREGIGKNLFSFSGNSIGDSLFAGFSSRAPLTSGTEQPESEEPEEYQPPKPEVRSVKEEDALYSVRCKLYFKIAQADWKEKGVGNLHIKPLSRDPEQQTTGRFQLLVRADTNLGNILLNILVSKAIHFEQSKNALTFMCVPNPPLGVKDVPEDKPVLMLLRVKTEQMATELLAQIQKAMEL